MQITKAALLVAAVCGATAVIGERPAAAVAGYFAVIGKEGDTTRGSGVASSQRLGRGKYAVTFTRNVSACSFVASVNEAASGFASTLGDEADPTRILVNTFATDSTRANRAFMLIVSCAP